MASQKQLFFHYFFDGLILLFFFTFTSFLIIFFLRFIPYSFFSVYIMISHCFFFTFSFPFCFLLVHFIFHLYFFFFLNHFPSFLFSKYSLICHNSAAPFPIVFFLTLSLSQLANFFLFICISIYQFSGKINYRFAFLYKS